ncbi:MAG: crossover junction endodeoxyribonuclease RuvC [Bacteroidota bacterium]|nr:crossover junction endodeoxyribonuclease RuvC [Bacteroidota bacterium]
MKAVKNKRIILGIDPGSLITGFGIIEMNNGKFSLVKCDAIVNNSKTDLPTRLGVIFQTLDSVIKKYKPDEIAIETAFYGKNAQSALKLGQARGVAMLSAVINKIGLSEYSPREVKKAVVGNGAASKDQVQYMVKSILKLQSVPKYYDITDALAVALCHSFRSVNSLIIPKKQFQPNKRRYKDWKSYVIISNRKINLQNSN